MALRAGAIRFNTDSSQMEIYDGNQWTGILATSPELQTGGTRMIFMGGTDGSSTLDVIEYVNIESAGNAIDFGNLIASEMEGGSLSSRLRGFYFGGDPADNDIEFVTFSSTGNAVDFGNLIANSKSGTGCSDQIRGIITHGAPYTNQISYITMASSGDSVDFGDTTAACYAGGASSSSTRGVIALGSTPSTNYSNSIDFITIKTTGNGQDFGDLSTSGVHCVAYSNATRGVFHSAYQYPASPNFMNVIQYVTIATLGNTTDFGDSLTGGYGAGGASPTRGVSGGGYSANAPTGETAGFTTIIDFIQIMSEGNAQDFGDLSVAKRHVKGDSNGHGGL